MTHLSSLTSELLHHVQIVQLCACVLYELVLCSATSLTGQPQKLLSLSGLLVLPHLTGLPHDIRLELKTRAM